MLLLCCYSRRVVLFKIEKKTKTNIKKNEEEERNRILAPTWQYTNREDRYETMPIQYIHYTINRKKTKQIDVLNQKLVRH
jgi:hypothetical protein